MEVLNIMRLSSRFILDNLFLLAAAFLVVASMTWRAGVAGQGFAKVVGGV